ncbi:DNA glycosylase [Hypoxylon sp. FL1284]|nr:DNA glycosylase [Hypoxylon sp. FL1284]
MRRSTRISSRQSASPAVISDAAEQETRYFSEDGEVVNGTCRKTIRTKRTAQSPRSDDSFSNDNYQERIEENTEDAYEAVEKSRAKRRRVAVRSTSKKENAKTHSQLYERLFGSRPNSAPASFTSAAVLPGRAHGIDYHRPLLLDNKKGRDSLLQWFDQVSTKRKMPWRKAWIDGRGAEDDGELRQQLSRRAYEVWISEVMLQQTRVAVVIDYWNRWMARWPTIRDLAGAAPDDVLGAWRGLGYYSRATRIHEAAKLVCADPDMRGLLPDKVSELVAKVPGVGRYTAGAIAAIVFGKPAPMVDGNVLRVLSRQLGLFGDVKSDKTIIDALWAAADCLVRAVAQDGSKTGNTMLDDPEDGEEQPSDRPGRWGQALMELGSTVCTPKPNCALCPISASCHAYDEGLQIAARKGLVEKSTANSDNVVVDIEDACTLCKPFEFADEDDGSGGKDDNTSKTSKQKKSKAQVQATLQSFAFTTHTAAKSAKKSRTARSSSPVQLDTAALDVIANHARKFPAKVVKKAVREEETLVCAIRRRSDGRYLIHRRPDKGLLAGMWELPSHPLETPHNSTPKTRKTEAEQYVSGLVDKTQPNMLKYVSELGSVPWLFSHLKLTMHVHLFELKGDVGDDERVEQISGDGKRGRWSDVVSIDHASMGTGMRKCWALVKGADEV